MPAWSVVALPDAAQSLAPARPGACACVAPGDIFFVDESTAPTSTFFATARAQSCDFSDSRHFHRYLVGHNASSGDGGEHGGPR